MQALKEINQEDSPDEDNETEGVKTPQIEGGSFLQPKLKPRKPSSGFDFKGSGLTVFAEFNFTRQKASAIKNSSPAPDLLKNLLKKSNENILKKAKASRKMVNKMISNLYQSSFSTTLGEGIDELLVICYDEFSQKYGLKKVADRKFSEFIASLIKNKSYKKCLIFMRFVGLGYLCGLENYSKFTFLLYLESLNYMLNSKIGITMNYEETDDKSMFPINRALECVKEKLENKIEKNALNTLINSLEHKAVPDPKRISTGLIELEFVLEMICEVYESVQKNIKKGVEMIFSAFGGDENKAILQYEFGLAVRFINPSKFQRFEGEETLNQNFTYEEACELSIKLNMLSKAEVEHFVKTYTAKPFESFEELIGIIQKMEEKDTNWISISEQKWRIKLDECKQKNDENSTSAVIAWRIYESELKRIQAEHL